MIATARFAASRCFQFYAAPHHRIRIDPPQAT